MKAIIRLHYIQGWEGNEPFWTVEVGGDLIEQNFDTEDAAIVAAKAAGARRIVHLNGGRPR